MTEKIIRLIKLVINITFALLIISPNLSASPTADSSCTTLSIGSAGDRVKLLQTALSKNGINTGPFDGIFGNITYSAVKEFETNQGIIVDGVVGSETWSTLGITNCTKVGVFVNPDKTLNVNGIKTFPVFMDNICNLYFEENTGVEPCDPSKNSGFLLSGGAMLKSESVNIKKLSEAGIFHRFNSNEAEDINEDLMNDPYFFGWLQPDESYNLPELANLYSNVKSKDSNHPVILNHWEDMNTYVPYGDIITWDIYTIMDGDWPREDSIYMYEQWSEQNFFKETNLNSISKPVWAVVQANGVEVDNLLVPTTKEARANTYTAITMDVKGIGFWGYLNWGGDLDSTHSFPHGTPGLYNNPSLHKYYRNLGKELVSLNDILVLPTKDYSWHYRKGTEVSFNKSLVKYVSWKERNNFNYLLKQSENTTYLIVVNKDSRPISNVGITISGLNGLMTAKTIGMETTGTGRADRILSVNNGLFTDNFDGYAVHIYEVSS